MKNTMSAAFPNVQAAIDAYRKGQPVILLDDSDREDEADLVAAAENMTVETMARMIRDGSGIVCLCLDEETVNTLRLPPMVQHNESRFSTGFTVTIEAASGITTGVSATDRLTTVRAALESTAFERKIVSPGHMFPLRSLAGGVLERRGHTEGSMDIARLAGMRSAAVLCELMNPDGSMMRGADLNRYAKVHGLTVLTMEELVRCRIAFDDLNIFTPPAVTEQPVAAAC